MSINKVIMSGNLTRDAELRQLPSGMSVADFTVAVNERAKNAQTGAWEDRANFVDCSIFGQRAEGVAKYLGKGTKVTVEGRLRQESWQDRSTGAKRSKLKVLVDELEFMSSRQQQEADQDELPMPDGWN